MGVLFPKLSENVDTTCHWKQYSQLLCDSVLFDLLSSKSVNGFLRYLQIQTIVYIASFCAATDLCIFFWTGCMTHDHSSAEAFPKLAKEFSNVSPCSNTLIDKLAVFTFPKYSFVSIQCAASRIHLLNAFKAIFTSVPIRLVAEFISSFTWADFVDRENRSQLSLFHVMLLKKNLSLVKKKKKLRYLKYLLF